MVTGVILCIAGPSLVLFGILPIFGIVMILGGILLLLGNGRHARTAGCRVGEVDGEGDGIDGINRIGHHREQQRAQRVMERDPLSASGN